MITEFRIADFKSFRSARLLFAPLTLLIGANASGKSNLVEGLRLMCWLAEGMPLNEMPYALRDGNLRVRGHVGDMLRNGCQSLGLGCSNGIGRECTTLDVALRLRKGLLELESERLEWEDNATCGYEAHSTGDDSPQQLSLRCFRGEQFFADLAGQFSNQRPLFKQVSSALGFRKGEPARSLASDVMRESSEMSRALKQTLFLDPEPKAMRGYSPESEVDLQENAANVSSVLYSICESTATAKRKRERNKTEVLKFVQMIPEQNITALQFTRTKPGDVMLSLTEADWGPRYAPLLSDGTLRVLAVAAALLSVPEQSLVVIEEVDSGIHPSRAKYLMEKIHEITKRRNLRILLTSHNPALINALPSEAVPDVMCCYRDPAEGYSCLVRLEDLYDYPAIIAQGALGDLMTAGVLDRYVKDKRSPEERRQAALDYIARMEADEAAR